MVLIILEEIKTNNNTNIPIHLKLNLTIQEASEYSNIGLNTLRKQLNKPGCTFALHIGNRTLIKRKEFEKWNESQRYIK